MLFVLKIGGSVLFPAIEENTKILKDLCKIIVDLAKKGHKIAVVAGGGAPARFYIRILENLGLSSFESDIIGINITKIHAQLMAYYTKKIALNQGVRVSDHVCENALEVLRELKNNDICFSGGFYPGQSTVAVASIIAEAINADAILLATNVDGVYDKDPKIHSDAKKFAKITVVDMRKILVEQSAKAGMYKLIDFVAIKIMERSGIPAVIFDGRNPFNLCSIVEHLVNRDMEKLTEIGTLIMS